MGEAEPYAIPEDVMVAHLEGEAVILNVRTKRYYRLNPTGAAIWKGLEQGLDPAAIAAGLVREFEVDAATAGTEVHRMLDELADRGLIGRSG